MLGKFFPGAYAKDVFAIDYQRLYDAGYRGLLFDVDNTLVHHGEDSNEAVDALFRDLRQMGFQTLLISDNGETRLQRFLKNIDACYIANAGKPDPESYFKAIQMLGISKEEAVCIGDQVFTDIRGANNAGLDSILVHYLVKNKHEWIGIRRYFEKLILVLFKFRKRHPRLGDVTKRGE